MNIDTTTVLQVINSNDIKITDWLQAIGTLVAATGAIVAFVALFKKDKQKQEQINKLVEVTGELKNQTFEISLQTQQMIEYNNISRELLNFHYKAQGANEGQQAEIIEIQKKALKSQYKPRFIWDSGYSSANHLNLTIKNLGETATITGLRSLEDGILNNFSPIGTEVNKNHTFNLEADYLGKENLHQINILVEVAYKDSIGTNYTQIFNIRGSNAELQPYMEVV